MEGLKQQQLEPDFYLDSARVGEVGKKLRSKEKLLSEICDLDGQSNDIAALIELCESEDDAELFGELQNELSSFDKKQQDLKIVTLLSGKYDACNAIMNIHAGAGGTEAQDWADMLYRMYKMYAEKNGYKLTVIDLLEGDEAGIKNINFIIEGDNAYGYLKAEKGIHRLVRISPFDANSRRHTSFASVEVMPELEEAGEIEIKPDELKIDTFRSSGAGGQHINKTESAIRITHIPTGIVVACQTQRSQIQNKEVAMKMLLSKLAEKQEREEMEHLASIKGEIKKIEWGSQIRSYVFCPYTLVKDHRTGCETSDIQAVMNGDIQEFLNSYLQKV